MNIQNLEYSDCKEWSSATDNGQTQKGIEFEKKV